MQGIENMKQTLEIRDISKVIDTLRQRYYLEENLSPWDINNGLYDQFADEVVKEIRSSEDEDIFTLSFLEITNTGDNDWTDFYLKSVSAFNIQPTHGLTAEQVRETMLKHADCSHVWVSLKTDDGYFFFDAETPTGVDNPLKLKTFDKFLNARALNFDEGKLNKYLYEQKECSIRDIEQTIDEQDNSLTM